MSMIFETHAHYDDHAFDEDRDELLSSFPQNGIGRVINASADADSLKTTKALTERYDFIYGAYGIHPDDLSGITPETEECLPKLWQDEKCAAVGEVGLDYHYTKEDRKQKLDRFAFFINAAKDYRLPLIIHSRDAAEDTYEVMKAENACDTGGVLHCYSYSAEMAGRFLDLGFSIGIGGVSTFKNAKKLREVIEYIPADRILLETDCPYMAPEPYRGKRNCSLYLPFVAEAVAGIKKMSPEEIIAVTEENAYRLFDKVKR